MEAIAALSLGWIIGSLVGYGILLLLHRNPPTGPQRDICPCGEHQIEAKTHRDLKCPNVRQGTAQ